MKLTWAQSVNNVRDESCQTALQNVVNSTPDLWKRPREPTVSPEDTAAKKSVVKRPKASTKEEECVEVPVRNNLRQKKPKPETKKQDWQRRVRPEAVLIKPAEGVSYAAILKISRSASNLTNWASQFREIGRRALRICGWN